VWAGLLLTASESAGGAERVEAALHLIDAGEEDRGARILVSAARDFAADAGMHQNLDQLVRALCRVVRAFDASGVERPPDALERFLQIYQRRLLVHTRPYPGMIDVLETLTERASLAVLTNKPLRSTRAILQGLDLARFFADDAVVGGDGPFPRKPDPAGLKHIQTRVTAPASASVRGSRALSDARATASAHDPRSVFRCRSTLAASRSRRRSVSGAIGHTASTRPISASSAASRARSPAGRITTSTRRGRP